MKPPRSEPAGFFRVMEWPTAVSLGALAGFLYSLKQVNPEVRIEWSIGSVITFVVATVISWRLSRMVFRSAEPSPLENQAAAAHLRKRRMIIFVSVFGVATIGSLAYSLKDVSPAKRLDVIIGTGCAFVAVAGALYGFWRLVQFLERHGLPEEEEMRDHSEDDDSDPTRRP